MTLRAPAIAPVVRTALHVALFTVACAAVICAAPGCGESSQERLGRETAAAAGPAVEAFGGDLEAARFDEALRRTTTAFRDAAPGKSLREVQDALARVLGRCRSRGPARAEWVDAAGDPPRVRAAVLAVDAAFERGAATIRARVERDAARDTWLLDAYEVRGPVFTWTLREVVAR